MIRVNVFCCLARDCNYCDVMKTCAMLISKADCIARDKILFSKLLDVFRNFYVGNHVSQKTKGEISNGNAIAYRENSNSSQEVKLQSKVASEKKHAQTVNCDNADGHWFTNRQSKKYRRVKFESNAKRLEALHTVAYLTFINTRFLLHLFWILQMTRRLKSFP